MGPIDFPEVQNTPNWKDINPRLGASYDLFGTGRSAVKASTMLARLLLSTSSALGRVSRVRPRLSLLRARIDQAKAGLAQATASAEQAQAEADRVKTFDTKGAMSLEQIAARAVFREDAHVRHLLGRVRLEEGRSDLALYDFEASLRLAPTHPNASWTRLQVEQLRARDVRPAPDEPPTPVP